MTTIPFVWKLQPFLPPKEWCTCRRCKRALFNLRSHVGVRGKRLSAARELERKRLQICADMERYLHERMSFT